nr:MAG TPA: DsbA family protein [Caudoviricetes sp.]
MLLNGKFRDDWCPNCKTRINWQKVDESEGKEKCGK